MAEDIGTWAMRVDGLRISLDQCETPIALISLLNSVQVQRIRNRAFLIAGRAGEREVEDMIGHAMARLSVTDIADPPGPAVTDAEAAEMFGL
jgi:hypothetical protein